MASGVAAAGSIAGGFIQGREAKKAGKRQARAAEEAARLQQQRYEQTRQDLSPYMQFGKEGIKTYADLLMGRQKDYGSFYKSPDYLFAKQQGEKSAERSAAARGGLLSGQQLKAMNRFGQGLASQQYGSYMDRLLRMASMGQSAATNTGEFGANAATAQGEYGTGAASARSVGNVVGTSNMLGGLGYGGAQLINSYAPQTGGYGAGPTMAAPATAAVQPAVQQPNYTIPFQTPIPETPPPNYVYGGDVTVPYNIYG